jgi:hypothetical protein
MKNSIAILVKSDLKNGISLWRLSLVGWLEVGNQLKSAISGTCLN